MGVVLGMDYLEMRKAPVNDKDETTERLVAMTNQTCLVALDKTVSAVSRTHQSLAVRTESLNDLGRRMCRASMEVGLTLPPELRVTSKRC